MRAGAAKSQIVQQNLRRDVCCTSSADGFMRLIYHRVKCCGLIKEFYELLNQFRNNI